MQKTYIAIALIIVLGFAVYANSLHGRFVWDDEHLIKQNIYIKNWSNLTKVFTRDIGAGSGRRYSSYRPLQMLSYMLDYTFWKLDLRGYHLSNILLHILAALTIYWLINILYHDSLLSLLTSLFFVVHPIHTEAVAYISGRADPLALLFMLLCFIFYLKLLESNHPGLYLLMLASYILALLSRENSLILPVLLLLYHYAFREKVKIKQFLPLLIIACIYILLRLTAFKSLSPHSLCSTTLRQRIPGFFAAITDYIRLLIFPFGLHMEYGDKLFNLTHPRALLGAVILSALLFYAFRIRKRKTNSLNFFALGWFILTILPVSNLYPIGIAYMAAHWLYLPSIGFFLILARVLSFLHRKESLRKLANVCIISLVALYSYLTIRQNNYWSEPVTLYQNTLKYVPDSARTLTSLGIAYKNLGRNQEAVALYKKAIEVTPTYADAHNSLGLAYCDIGKYEAAIASFKKAIELNPDYAFAYNNLGFLYNNIGENKQAITSFKKAIELNPDYALAYNNLGSTYRELGRKLDAVTLYKQAIELNPTYAEAHYNLANAYSSLGKTEQAIGSYKRAIECDPNLTQAYINLANAYSSLGKTEQAIVLYKQAIEINAGFAEAYNNLGIAYNALGDSEQAIASFKKAIELNPNHAKAHYSLSIAYFNNKQYRLAIEYCDKAKALGFVNPALLEALKPYREDE